MNIFKVIASGRKKFQEETASAVLAWFLNPYMEHGLGYEFLSRFLTGLRESSPNTDLSTIINNLTPKLRSETDDSSVNFWCSLEMPVTGAFIDIVLGIDNYVIAIENKIYSTSASENQLVREYKGIKEKLPENHIGMVYLIPIDAPDSPPDAKIQAIYDELEPSGNDFKALITWQENNFDNATSIASIIHSILKDEALGEIEPISDYCRHTLKALLAFIRNDFAGYDYDKSSSHSGQNPLTEERLTINQLKGKLMGFVGLSGGIRGLIRIGKEGISSRKFQYSTSDMTHSKNWVELNMFNGVVDWIVDGKVGDIKWSGKFPSEMIYKIAQDYKIYVGIRGGESALRNMTPDVIKTKEWAIATENEGKNSQWIDGGLYCQILDGETPKSNQTERSTAIITEADLRRLLSLSQNDIQSFFSRNPKYNIYSGKECLIVLAQGGALHFLDKKTGVKDFDIWFFYPQIEDVVLPFRRRGVVDFGESKFGKHPDDKGFEGRKIDVLMRSDAHFNKGNPADCIKKYLSGGKTETAQMLAMKAVIGLYPEQYFGEILWRSENRE